VEKAGGRWSEPHAGFGGDHDNTHNRRCNRKVSGDDCPEDAPCMNPVG
jgi:hypothetical protein